MQKLGPNPKRTSRIRRHRRVRAKISGTATRPRLSVFRGLTTTYAQLIDDVAGKTIAAVHSKTATGDAGERKGKVAQAYLVGKMIAEKASGLKIESIVFDRGGFRYAGRVQAVAEGARDGGLKF